MILRRRRQRAEARMQDAAREAEVSRERLARAREQVIEPLKRKAERNQFALIIAESLLEGYRR